MPTDTKLKSYWPTVRAVASAAAMAAVLLSSCCAGCSATTTGVDSKTISELKLAVHDVGEQLLTAASGAGAQAAGDDAVINDTWAVRILVAMVGLLGLSYPVGKIVWLVTTALKNKTSSYFGRT